MSVSGSEKCKDLTSQLTREMNLAQQHFANAMKLSEMLDKCHIQEETKSPHHKNRTKSKSPGREKIQKDIEPFRVKVSGGPDKQSFEVGTQSQTMKKLSDKFPGKLSWQKSSLDFIIIPNDVSKPSKTSEKMLKKDGSYMHYDEFVSFMSNK